MKITAAFEARRNRKGGTPEEKAAKAAADAEALRTMKPLPLWFFVFEGLFGGAYDIIKTAPAGWVVLAVICVVNMVITLTVLGKRRKLVQAMLKDSRTRFIAIGLIALRFAVHLTLGAATSALDTTGGHLAMAALMTVVGVGMLWFDQRVTFRALGIPLTADDATVTAPAGVQLVPASV